MYYNIERRPVATDCNRFYTVFEIFNSRATATATDLEPGATATGGPVAVGWVQSGPGLFSGPCNRTLIH